MKAYIFLIYLSFTLTSVNTLTASNLMSAVYDPANLRVGWWKQFQNEEDNKDNIDNLIAELETLKSQLDPEKHPLTIIQIEQVIVSAQQIKSKRAEKIDYQPIHPLYLPKYTIADLMEVSDKIQTLENKNDRVIEQIERLQQSIDHLRNEVDHLQLKYPLQESESVERLELGLQIMNLRFIIEAHDLEIKRLKKLSNLQTDNLIKLKKEQDIAVKRMDFSNLQKPEISKQIDAAKLLLVTANRLLLSSRQEATTTELASFDEIKAKLQILQIKTVILFEDIKLVIAHLDHGKEQKEAAPELIKLNGQLQLLISSAKDIEKSLKTPHNFETTQSQEIQDLLTALQNKLSNSELLISLVREKAVEKETSFSQKLQFFTYELIDRLNFISKYSNITVFRVNDYPITIWVLIRAIFVFITTIILSRFLLHFIKNFDRLKSKIGNANTYILATIFYYLAVVFGFLAAIYSTGFDMRNFVIIAGALGVGVGLGLQAIANNFFSGLVVLFSKVLKVGDVIETEGGFIGVVKAIRMQNIHLRTFDGKDIILPNSDLVTKNVINWTMVDPFIRLHIPFGVEYGTDKELVEKIVINVANKFTFTMNNERICPKPQVWLVNFGDNALNLELVTWVNIKQFSSRGSMKAEYLWEIEKELRRNGITIPYPKSDVSIIKLPEITLKNSSAP